MRVFRQKFTLEDAIGPQASRRVTNGVPLGCSLLVPVDTVNCFQTLKAPLASPFAAVDKLRVLGGVGNTVVLRTGTYYMSKTLAIGPMDVNLTIQAYPGEQPWLSGAAKLEQPVWSKVNTPGTPLKWSRYNKTNAVYGLQCAVW
jgi:hypothetical protein